MPLKRVNVALGATLDATNIELEKITKGPINYAISNIEFALPIKEIEIDKQEEIVILFPKTTEETAKAQYFKVSIQAVPKVVTPFKVTKELKVEDMEWIDDATSEKLRKLGIKTVSDLAVPKAEELATKLKITKSKARDYIDMAAFIVKSRFAGISRLNEVGAELLVKGAGICSVTKLATTDAKELFNSLNNLKLKRKPFEFLEPMNCN